MAKINYSFEKRQRELAKKKQKDEKLAKKRAARDGAVSAEMQDEAASDAPIDDVVEETSSTP